MKSLFVMSLVSAVVSLLALFGFSVMSYVPGPGVEKERAVMMTVAGLFAIAWLGVALWARPRRNAELQPLPPKWLRRLLVGVGAVYTLAVLMLVVG